MKAAETTELIDLALREGAVAAGVCRAGPFHPDRDALAFQKTSGRSGPLHFTYDSPEVSADITATYPWARSLVVVAAGYLPESSPPSPRGALIARFADSDHYRLLEPPTEAVKTSLIDSGHRAVVVYDENHHLDRAAAVAAGVGWRGRSTMVLTPFWGPWTLLGAVVTDAHLSATAPMRRGCGTCVACLPACPTGAIDGSGVDARRCLSTWLQTPGPIPFWIRPILGRRIYGCDDCLVACPPGAKAASSLSQPSEEHDFVELLTLSDDQLLQRFAWWYVPRRDPRFMRRNIVIAAGNSGEPETQPALSAHVGHRSALVRGHAAWALATSTGEAAVDRLEEALRVEAAPEVREEILIALRMVESPEDHADFLNWDEAVRTGRYARPMASKREPVTTAVRAMRQAGIVYEPYLYEYQRHPGALGAAEAIGVDPHLTVKTLVFETDRGQGVIVLMNGDREVSTKGLGRLMGTKRVEPASARRSRRWTGYEFGGTSPFGTRERLPLYAQDEIAGMDKIYLNAGKRGFVVAIDPTDLVRALDPVLADLAG